MNQSIIFNEDLMFDKSQNAWCFSALLSGQKVHIYFHSMQLQQLITIDSCTKFDLEEIVELWLEKNEPENHEIHINMR